MILDLKGYLNSSNRCLDIDTAFDFSGECYMGVFPFKNPVKVRGSVSNKADITKLELNCTVVINMPCDRCGTDTEKTLNVNISRTLVKELAGDGGDEYLVVADEKLDLYELVLREVILNFPMKFLCSDDCKGVCPMCGKNLNNGPCGCVNKEIDPRLEALKKLLEDE